MSPKVKAIKAPRGASWFELGWSDQLVVRLPNRILRGYCPCAGCQGHGGEIHFRDGHDSELKEIEEVGRYGLRLVWGDGHGDGIYTFEHLRLLCELQQQHGEALPEAVPALQRSS